MKLTLTIKSCCTVSLTIPILLTVKRQILLCSRWLNIATLTYKTQLASILSISCNIQHLAQQQSQCKLQWSMLRKRTFDHFQLANMANKHSGPHNNIIKWTKATAAWKQKESETLRHCAACDPKWSLWPRNNEKRTSSAMERRNNGLRIMLREKLLGWERELKMQRQRFSKSRKIRAKLKMWDWWMEIQNWHFRWWCLRSERGGVILQVPTMGRMGKMRIMKRQSKASRAKMTNAAGWWAHTPMRNCSTWTGFDRSRWSMKNWHSRDGRTQPTTLVREIRSTAHPNGLFGQLLHRKRIIL